ncbi:MAG: DUF6057 family protein [Dysgonamonadaceae bacterium]|jgi:hypothetical protein|nr:DUF6057 family protein [Dysgonamonadaceae bacterium]
MKKVCRYGLPCLLPVIIGVWYFFACPYTQHFKEQLLLFSGDWSEYLQKPAVLSAFAGDYLTQFFLLTGGAAVVFLLVLAVLWWGVRLALIRCKIKNSDIVALLPVAAEAALSCLLEYPLSMTIGAALSVWLFVAVARICQTNVRLIVACFAVVVAYVAFGSHFLLLSLLLILFETRHRRNGFFVIMILVVSIVTPIVASYHYLLTMEQTWLYPFNPYFLRQIPFIPFVTETALLAAIIFACSNLKRGILYAVAVILCVSGMYVASDFRREYHLALLSEAYFGHWGQVKRLTAHPKHNTYLSAYYGNLAAAREGRLPDELLKRYQPAQFGLFLEMNETIPYTQMMASVDALLVCGDLAQAQHSAMLGMLFSPNQRSSRMARRLAEITRHSGDYQASDKFLYLLSRTLFHRDWAKAQSCLNEPIVYPQKDTLFSTNDWHTSLVNLLESAPENKIAADYLLCYDLLRKDIQQFKVDYDRYYLPNFGSNPPAIYREAMLMNLKEEDAAYVQNLSFYHIDDQTVGRGHQFLSAFENDGQNSGKMRLSFGDTYWFYYFYAQLK